MRTAHDLIFLTIVRMHNFRLSWSLLYSNHSKEPQKWAAMGKGQRHSKNAGGMGTEGLTYNERRGLGFGMVKERLGKVPVRAHMPL